MSSRSIRPLASVIALGALLATLPAGAAQGSGTIYASRTANGHLTLSDEPVAGAVSVTRHVYPAQTDAQRAAAERERAYWHEEAGAYSRRHQSAQRHSAGAPRPVGAVPGTASDDVLYPVGHYGYGYGMVHRQPQAPAYTSSPGAVNGRVSAPFIGSGFSRAR